MSNLCAPPPPHLLFLEEKLEEETERGGEGHTQSLNTGHCLHTEVAFTFILPSAYFPNPALERKPILMKSLSKLGANLKAFEGLSPSPLIDSPLTTSSLPLFSLRLFPPLILSHLSIVFPHPSAVFIYASVFPFSLNLFNQSRRNKSQCLPLMCTTNTCQFARRMSNATHLGKVCRRRRRSVT